MEQISYIESYSQKYIQVVKAIEDALKVISTKPTPLYQINTTFLQNLKTELITLKTNIDTLDEHNFAQLLFVQQSWQLLQESMQDQLNELEATINSRDKTEQFAKKYLTEFLSKLKQTFELNVLATEFYAATAQQLIQEAFASTHLAIRQLTLAQPKCFISYAWGITEHEQLATKLAAHLQLLGFEVWFDRWSNPAGAYIDYFTAKIREADYVILLGSKKLVAKYNEGQALYEEVTAKRQQLEFSQNVRINRNYIVNLELHQIFTKGLHSPGAIVPLLLDSTLLECLPPNDLQNVVPLHFTEHRDTKVYSERLFELVQVLLPHATIKTLVATQQQILAERLALLSQHVQTDDWKQALATYAANKQQHQSEHQTAIAETIRAITEAGRLGGSIYQPLPSVDNLPGSMSNRHQMQASTNRHAYPNTNEVITQVTALLRQHYQTPPYAELKRLLHERTFPITESFINLAIVKEQEQKPKEEQLKKNEQLKGIELLSREALLNSFETIYQAKAPIKLEDLLLAQRDERQVAKRQLIEGRAGIGKTTLCQYLAHQWAAGDSKWQTWRQQFDWVIHLSLRELTTEEQFDFSKLSLADWLYKQYLTPATQQHITIFELRHAFQALDEQGKMLLLLDGYDEIVPVLKTNRSFQQFFERELLSCTYWFIFSRPYYVTDNRVERRLENIGFTQDNIPQYVQQYFRDIEKEKHISQQTYADSLMAYLNQNPNAMGIAHIPINLELLCYVWNEDHSLNNQLTLTELYNHLVLRLFGRYLHKYFPNEITSPSITWDLIQTDTDYQCQQMLVFLQQLAWDQMQQPGLIISANVIKNRVRDFYPELKQQPQKVMFGEMVLKQLGLLKGCDIHKPVLEQSYYFIHLTFQEYFAARYWVKLFQNENTQAEAVKFLNTNKFNPRYEIVWRMIAGLQAKDKMYQEKYFHLLLNKPKDLVGLNHLLLQIQCLEETYSKETSFDSNIFEKIILDNLNKWIKFQILKKLYFGYHLANYLAFCPNLMCHDKIINLWGELLKNQDEAVKVYAVSCLAKSIQLPEKLLIKLLDLLEDLLKNGGSLNLIHHIEVVLLKQSMLSKVLLERILLLKDWEIRFENLAKILSKSCSADNTFIIDKLEPLLTSTTLQHVFFAAKVLAGVDNLREEILLKLIDLLKIGEINIKTTVSNALAKQIKLPEAIIKLVSELYQNNRQYKNKYTFKILLCQPDRKDYFFNEFEKWLSGTDITQKTRAINILDNQENLPESVVNKLVESIKTIQVVNKDVEINTPIREQALENSNENFGFAYSCENEYANFKFKAIRIILRQKSISNTFFTYYLSLLKESKFPLNYIYFLEIKNNHTSLPDELLKYILMLLSEKIPIFEQGILRILSAQNRLSDLILHQILNWLGTNDNKLQSYALYILCFHKNILLKSFLKNIYTFLQDDNLHSDAAIVLSNQSLELNCEEIKELIKGLHDKEKRNSILQVLSSQTKFDQDVFSELDNQLFSQGLLNDYLLVIKNISPQSIAILLKSEQNLSKLLPLIHVLFLKSLQTNIPLYFVKNDLYLGNNKISLNIEKTLVIQALNQVILTLTGWEPELTANNNKEKKAVSATDNYQSPVNVTNNTSIEYSSSTFGSVITQYYRGMFRPQAPLLQPQGQYVASFRNKK